MRMPAHQIGIEVNAGPCTSSALRLPPLAFMVSTFCASIRLCATFCSASPQEMTTSPMSESTMPHMKPPASESAYTRKVAALSHVSVAAERQTAFTVLT